MPEAARAPWDVPGDSARTHRAGVAPRPIAAAYRLHKPSGMLRSTIALASCLAFACVEVPDDEVVIDESSAALTGGAVAHRPGVVQISIPGDPQVRTGLLVAPDLVMVSRRWFHSGMTASSLTVRHGATATSPTQPGWELTVNSYMPMAFLQVAQPFTGVPAVTFTSRTAPQLVGTAATCFGFDSATAFGQAGQSIVALDGEREVLGQASPNGLEDHDAGAPCFNVAGGFIGFVLDTRGSGASYRSRIFAINDTVWHVQNHQRLARVRRASPSPQGFKLQYEASQFTAMCADTASNPYDRAAVSSFPCHGGKNQRWLMDLENPNGPAFINLQTATCIDVPGGTTVPGTQLLLNRCNGGRNQVFQQGRVGPADTGATLAPANSPTNWAATPPRRTLCMVARGGASALSSVLEQATCSTNNQPFTFELWKLVL